MIETAVPVSANQVECSLTSERAMYDGTLDDCITKKRVAMAWSPLGSYFRENDERVKRIKKVMGPFKEKYQLSEDQLILAWLMKHPARIHPVVGTTNKDRLTDGMKASKIDMELEDWFTLLTASQGHKVP